MVYYFFLYLIKEVTDLFTFFADKQSFSTINQKLFMITLSTVVSTSKNSSLKINVTFDKISKFLALIRPALLTSHSEN